MLFALANSHLTIRQIAGNLPWFGMVNHVRERRVGILHRRRKTPPKTGHLIGSLTTPELMEGHQAVFDRGPKMRCTGRGNHTYMILFRRLEFNNASAATV